MSESKALFQIGDFTLNSGVKSKWKIECDNLTDESINCLAEIVCHMVGSFSEVHGVPRGGLRLEAALKPHCTPGGPVLIVDDVLTTGGSMNRLANEKMALPEYRGKKFSGVVIFARGQCPHWVRAVFQMPDDLWIRARAR